MLKLLAALYSSREQTVKALLPVCAWCNRVSNDRNEWKEIGEKYLEAHLAVGDQSDLVLVVHDITETRSLKNAVLKLLAALYSSREQTVKALLPVCAWCNRVSNDRNEWKEIGELIEEMSLASTTHSICPDCTNRQSAHFPAN